MRSTLKGCGLDTVCAQVGTAFKPAAVHSPHVSKWDSLASAKGDACLFDATHELRVMFESILEPFLFRRKSDEDAGRATVPRDDDLFIDRESQIPGQVILHLRQCHLFRA